MKLKWDEKMWSWMLLWSVNLDCYVHAMYNYFLTQPRTWHIVDTVNIWWLTEIVNEQMVELLQPVLLLNAYNIYCMLYHPFGSDYVLPSLLLGTYSLYVSWLLEQIFRSLVFPYVTPRAQQCPYTEQIWTSNIWLYISFINPKYISTKFFH